MAKSADDKARETLLEKIAIAEERARFEEAHARIAEAKVRRLKANEELASLSKSS